MFLGYFDLNRRSLSRGRVAPAEKRPTARIQVSLYLGLFIGVLFSDLISALSQGVPAHWNLTVVKVVGSAIAAIAYAPQSWEKLKVDPEAPFLYQFSLFVQSGLLWRAVADFAVGAAGH